VSQDGTPDPRDQGSTGEPTQPAEWVLPPDGQSRRHFLRNALIGSAAAAAVVGGGAAVAASPLGPRVLSKIRPLTANASPTDPYAICFEDTMLLGSPTTSFNVDKNGKGTTPGSFWLFYTARLLPAGSYTLDLTQSVNGGAGQPVNGGPGSATAPFIFQDSQAVHFTVTTSAVADCPTTKPGGTSGTSYGPVTVTAGQTIQWAVHLTWDGGTIGSSGATETISFTGELAGIPASLRTTATATITQS
jgi:hypothetical protein